MMENWLLKLAWQTAFRMRTCPPLRLLKRKNSPEVRAHLDTCPFCKEELNNYQGDISKWKYLGQHFLNKEESSFPPTPGDIWSLKNTLAGWGPENGFYQPPLVLILENREDLVLVCQTYWDKVLMGPDDIFLGEEIGFAETWNNYTIYSSHLDHKLKSIPSKLLKQVKLNVEKKWQDIDTRSTLYFFRELEIKVGSYFSQKSIQEYLQEHTLRQRIKKDHPNLLINRSKHRDIRYILATAELEEKAMAAADRVVHKANYLLITPDKTHLFSILLEITHRQITEEGLIIGGKISSEIPYAHQIYGWWDTNSTTIPAEESEIDTEGKFFRLFFSGDPELFKQGDVSFLIEGFSDY